MKRKIFTVDLYGYLNEEKSKVCREYQDHNKSVIESSAWSDKYDYVRIDSDEEIESFVNSNECMLRYLPKKYYYQLITDLCRYKYMVNHPDSVYFDTDFALFGKLGMELINKLSDNANDKGIDFLCTEINKNRFIPCNWLMIGGNTIKDGSTNVFQDMYNLLKERLNVKSYNELPYSPDSKWPNKMEDYIWTYLWGYAIPLSLSIQKFHTIPYEYFQAYEWNKDWKDDSVMRKDYIVGSHFFGFGEGGRPELSEFIKYHGLENMVDGVY